MGVRISYYGDNGKMKSLLLDGSTSRAERLKYLAGELDVVDPLEKAPGSLSYNMGPKPVKVKPNGGLKKNLDGSVGLRGENNITPDAAKAPMAAYMKSMGGGQPWCGFGTLNDLDVPMVGPVIGKMDATDVTPDAENRSLGNVGSFGQMYVARLVAAPRTYKENSETKTVLALYAMYRAMHNSHGGRVWGVDKEIPVYIGDFGGSGGASTAVTIYGPVRYDNTGDAPTYSIQQRVDTLNLGTGVIAEGAWQTVCQTTPHVQTATS